MAAHVRGGLHGNAAARYSYATASSTSMSAARRAGPIEASAPASAARTNIAASGITRVDQHEAEPGQRLGHQRREADPECDPQHRADQRRDHRLERDHLAHLAAQRADRPQHPELPGALEDRERQRVGDPEQRHEHRQREQRVDHDRQLLDPGRLFGAELLLVADRRVREAIAQQLLQVRLDALRLGVARRARCRRRPAGRCRSPSPSSPGSGRTRRRGRSCRRGCP